MLTRFEVIDHRSDGKGRIFVALDCEIDPQYQDDDRTLKVFLRDRKVESYDEFIEALDATFEPHELQRHGRTFIDDHAEIFERLGDE